MSLATSWSSVLPPTVTHMECSLAPDMDVQMAIDAKCSKPVLPSKVAGTHSPSLECHAAPVAWSSGPRPSSRPKTQHQTRLVHMHTYHPHPPANLLHFGSLPTITRARWSRPLDSITPRLRSTSAQPDP